MLLGTESDHVSPGEEGRPEREGEAGEAGWGDGEKLGVSLRAVVQGHAI